MNTDKLDQVGSRLLRRWSTTYAGALLAIGGCAAAATFLPAAAQVTQGVPLRVGIVDNYLPCSDTTANGFEGFSIEIWRRVSERLNQPYSLVSLPSFSAAVDRAADGSVDLVASCHRITAARVQRVEFSVPYTQDSLAILSRKRGAVDLGLLERLASDRAFILSLSFLLVTSFAAAVLVGRLEHGFRELSGFKESDRSHLVKAWIMLLIGAGVDKFLHKSLRAYIVILTATLARLLFISILVGTVTGLILEVRRPVEASKLRKSELEAILKDGLAVNEGTKMHDWVLARIKQYGINPHAGIGLIPVLKEGSIGQLLNSGMASHALSDISALNSIRRSLENPGAYFISVQKASKTPQAFVFGRDLGPETKRLINAEIARMNYNGDTQRLSSIWRK